jgi:hypothetical protein
VQVEMQHAALLQAAGGAVSMKLGRVASLS